jgi:hypothetical protein
MQVNPVNQRDQDALKVPEGRYFEPYTPAVGRISSTSLGGKKLQYAKMYLSADANVTFRDEAGNAIVAFPLLKGPQPFLVTEVSVVSAGSVALMHDGQVWSNDTSLKDMTSDYVR